MLGFILPDRSKRKANFVIEPGEEQVSWIKVWCLLAHNLELIIPLAVLINWKSNYTFTSSQVRVLKKYPYAWYWPFRTRRTFSYQLKINLLNSGDRVWAHNWFVQHRSDVIRTSINANTIQGGLQWNTLKDTHITKLNILYRRSRLSNKSIF